MCIHTLHAISSNCPDYSGKLCAATVGLWFWCPQVLCSLSYVCFTHSLPNPLTEPHHEAVYAPCPVVQNPLRRRTWGFPTSFPAGHYTSRSTVENIFQSEQLSQHITSTFHHTSSACANQLESSSKSPWCYASSFNLSRLIINFQEPLETRHSSSMVRRKLPARPVTKPTSAAPLHKVENAQKPMVDGRNPAPVDMVNIPLFTGTIYIPGGCLGFLPSTVLQPFWWIPSLPCRIASLLWYHNWPASS